MKTLLKNAKILDAETDYLQADVLVEDEKITAVGQLPPATPDMQVVDLSGCTLMPMFVDNHIHVSAHSWDNGMKDGAIREFAENGVCAVKDLGILGTAAVRPLNPYLAWLKAHRGTEYTMVRTAGRYIDVDHGYGAGPGNVGWGYVINTPEEAADKVTEQYNAGVDGIKIGLNDGTFDPVVGKLSLEHLKAIADRARSHGIWTSAHLYKVDDLRLITDAGFDEAAHTPKDRPGERSLYREMIDRGMTMTTTIGRRIYHGMDIDRFPPFFKNAEAFIEHELPRYENTLENVRLFAEEGGLVCIGTDFMQDTGAGIPVEELRHMKEMGISMTDCIKAGTINCAKSLEMDDIGLVRPGMKACVLAFHGELDDNFAQLVHPEWVMNRGNILRSF